MLLLVLALSLAWLLRDAGPDNGQDTGPRTAGVPSPAPVGGDAGQSVLMAEPLHVRPSPRTCTHDVTGPFRPVSATATDATADAQVLALPRDADGVPGVPPLTSSGKNAFAWDQPPGTQPGSRRGNVLLNAHTWPDGTALGNRLLAGLDKGEQVVLRGARGEQLCYRVTDRVEVRADQPFPRYYRDTGRPQVAIVVCSGQRLGPGNWTHRTVWFARPAR